MKEIFKRVISDFHRRGLPDFVGRELEIPLNSGKIISLIGARRTGKTYMFYQIIRQLLDDGVAMDNIVFINFEDERLEVGQSDLASIEEAYLEIFPDADLRKVYFFFDEIHNVSGWEKFVRRLHDTVSLNVFVTGSSAKMLSTEIATSLRGRTVAFDVYPLSFGEYLSFLGEGDDVASTAGQAKTLNLFLRYLQCGGFPEVVKFDERLRIKTLQNYANVMMYQDIVERYDVRNIEALEQFIKKNIASVATRQSIVKTYNQLRSLGVSISKDSLYDFARYCQDAFYLFYLSVCDPSITKQNRASKKVYAIDTGLVNATSFAFSENIGRLLENIVFIHLKRQEKTVCYYDDGNECDFVVRREYGVDEVLQVTKSIKDESTKNREIAGLVSAMNAYNLSEGTILTQDEFGEEIIDGKKIKIIPIYKWLLS